MEHQLPTAEQKLAIYQKAREHVVKNESSCRFICIAIYDAQQDLGFVTNKHNNKWSISTTNQTDSLNCMENNFPELFKLKPKGKLIGEAWWVTYRKKVNPARLNAIHKMIAEVQEKLQVF